MNRLISILFFVVSIPALAQNNADDTITFLGIPVEGSAERMIDGLKERGFKQEFNSLSGIFNGEDVRIEVGTNHAVVDRVSVFFPHNVERITKIKYNTLISRFGRNSKYVVLRDNQEIPEGEDISYEITFHNKVYDAVYYLLRSGINAEQWKEDFFREYKVRYSKPLTSLSQEEVEEVLFCLPPSISEAVSGVVWFTLPSDRYIVLHYDNLKNRPRGEDL